ncbi:Uncharacterised protein [Escherichia coli]|uniref:Uncharacterized protein n=1 Tax=Escherichia coli TaxID=562 RepID=A0A376TTS0_ECOLX|nr:Uncharacterised protein [Escherichia coli]
MTDMIWYIDVDEADTSTAPYLASSPEMVFTECSPPLTDIPFLQDFSRVKNQYLLVLHTLTMKTGLLQQSNRLNSAQ